MFGFGKKKEPKEPKKKSTIDKLIMGAIVGGAIGSVVGMNLAPKKGKETREYLTQKSKDLYEKGKEIGTKIQESGPTKHKNSKKILFPLKKQTFSSKRKTQSSITRKRS